METPTVSGLRSRSRSKTPFLRSSCDRELCAEGEDHTHLKSGRKTPVKRSTPIKQLHQPTTKLTKETITETEEEHKAPAHRTRHSTRIVENTSDYSSGESQDRLRGHRKEILQNDINSQYERVSTSTRGYSTLADVTLSPITAQNVTRDRSFRFGSPAHSACSTDSSFAEQALADTSLLLDRDPAVEHLPYRLYKMAGEYWNKYPKTDYTYSPLSKDRVELAPGQVAVPNMSRRSLSQFRVQGPVTSADEVDRLATWTTNATRKRFTNMECSDDEGVCLQGNGGYRRAEQHWLLTRLLLAIITTVTTTVSSAASAVSGGYRKLVGPSHRYPYTERRPANAGVFSRAASASVAPFYWIYTVITKIVTNTVTTVTETITSNHVDHVGAYKSSAAVASRRRWPWLLLLLLPAVAYGSHYTYENWEHLALPNFTDFQLDLPEFSAIPFPKVYLPSLPNITLPTINLTMPDINITLPTITDNLPDLPEVTKAYREYKDIVQNRVADASDYLKVVGESCFEEMRRFWRGVIG